MMAASEKAIHRKHFCSSCLVLGEVTIPLPFLNKERRPNKGFVLVMVYSFFFVTSRLYSQTAQSLCFSRKKVARGEAFLSAHAFFLSIS
jgi:hypothetical protein